MALTFFASTVEALQSSLCSPILLLPIILCLLFVVYAASFRLIVGSMLIVLDNYFAGWDPGPNVRYRSRRATLRRHKHKIDADRRSHRRRRRRRYLYCGIVPRGCRRRQKYLRSTATASGDCQVLPSFLLCALSAVAAIEGFL